MGQKRVSTFVFSALLLIWAGSAAADQYRADEFLSLDLSKAVLSPKRLGPPAEFVPVAVEARSEAPRARAEPSADRRASVRTTGIKQKARVDKPRAPARTQVVRRPGNLLDAQAMDTRIQKWPCKSGGICGWKP